MKWITVTCAAMLLTACTQSVDEMSYTQLKQYAEQMVEKCKKQGIPDAELEACARQEIRADQSRRVRQRQIGAAISQASADYGRNAQAAAQANMHANRSVNCTSTRFGNTVRTNCY